MAGHLVQDQPIGGRGGPVSWILPEVTEVTGPGLLISCHGVGPMHIMVAEPSKSSGNGES